MYNLYRALSARGVEVAAACYLRDNLTNPTLLRCLDDCDIAIINGEGTIHHNSPYAERLIRVVSESTASKKVLLNTTYACNPPHHAEWLRNFGYIYVRDSGSKAELKSAGISAEVVPDMTFLSETVGDRQDNGHTLITDSVVRDVSLQLFKLRGGVTGARPLSIFAKQNGFFKKLLQIRRRIGVADILSPAFLANTISASRWFQDGALSSDVEFAQKIQNARFLISGRYHAVCMAIQSGTPFMAVDSNTFKIRALLDDIGLQNRCLSHREFFKLATVEQEPFSKEESQLVRHFCDDAKRKITRMFETICSDA